MYVRIIKDAFNLHICMHTGMVDVPIPPELPGKLTLPENQP